MGKTRAMEAMEEWERARQFAREGIRDSGIGFLDSTTLKRAGLDRKLVRDWTGAASLKKKKQRAREVIL